MTALYILNVLLLLLMLLYCFGTTSAWVGTAPSIIESRSRPCRPIGRIVNSHAKTRGKRFLLSFTLEAISTDDKVEIMERTTTTIKPMEFIDRAEITTNSNNNNTGVGTTHSYSEIINATTELLESYPHDDDSSLMSSSLDLQQEQQEMTTKVYTREQKFTNLVVLSLAFGYAIYTILSIDGGMTRGWSASEIAMRIPLDNWGAYESYLATKPILTKSLINVIIYLLGDWLSQTAFTKTNNLLEFDLQRTLRNGFIGLCFGPLVHEYYEFSDTILPPQNGLLVRLQKILMDQTIYLTVKCSMYIGAVGLLAGEDRKTVWETIQGKIGGIVITAWKFWPIVHCVTYSVVPTQHRVLWVNSVDLVWNAILSSAAQKDEEIEDGEVQSIVEANIDEAIAPVIVLQRTKGGNGQTNTTNAGVAWVAA